MEKELKRLSNELDDIEHRVENVLKASSTSTSSVTGSSSADTKQDGAGVETAEGGQSEGQSNAPSEMDEVFKNRVNEFLKNARDECREQEENFNKCKSKFQKVKCVFCVKPRPGESEVTPDYFFSLWVTFGHHFKDAWKRETQKLIKQR